MCTPLAQAELGSPMKVSGGSAQYHLGNYSGTIETFEKAIGAGAPVGPATVAYLMAANVRLGRHARAKILTKQYAESWPMARFDLMLRRLLGEPQYAEDVISAMLDAGWSPP